MTADGHPDKNAGRGTDGETRTYIRGETKKQTDMATSRQSDFIQADMETADETIRQTYTHTIA